MCFLFWELQPPVLRSDLPSTPPTTFRAVAELLQSPPLGIFGPQEGPHHKCSLDSLTQGSMCLLGASRPTQEAKLQQAQWGRAGASFSVFCKLFNDAP